MSLALNSGSTSFKAARRFVTSALSGVALFGLAATAAHGQQVRTVGLSSTPSPACASIKDSTTGIQCEIRESIRRTNEYKARAKAADDRAATLEAKTKDMRVTISAQNREAACLDIIIKDVENNGARTASLTAVPPKGKACAVARELKLISG